ncbi:hypothetical protein T05_7550 [Trichinella murrelli]|uniref:Uncharacterized protein n=1 Tax=Trichinella murrelli TaxID=144512 RepID=A0A0V0TUK5_9BILA|nr:hypothetical protein T05_7550 [Trichinella murrelli]
MNSQLILNYWAHAWYLFENLEKSTSMCSGNYSEHLRNYGVLSEKIRNHEEPGNSFNPNYTVFLE